MKKYPRVSMRTKAALLFLSCFLLWIPSLHGQVSFFQAPKYTALGPPSALSDINGDGKLDVIGCLTGCKFQPGNGDGTFGTVQQITTAYPTVLALADFNGDGKLDILEQTSGTLAVQFGNGDATFQAPVTTFINLSALTGVAVGDLRNFGRTDVLGIANGTLYVILGNGDGTFAAPVPYAAANLNAGTLITLGDFNGDHKIDVVLSTSSSSAGFEITFPGVGDGTLGTPVTSAGLLYQAGASSGDFNNDGKLDLAISAGNVAQSTSILTGNGDGTFSILPSTYPGAIPVISDFNQDGKLDMATSLPATIYLGHGDGTFDLAYSYFEGNGNYSTLLGDVNGDGRADILVGGSVLLGNGNGSFQGTPALQVPFVSAFVANGDFDGNGSQDVAITSGGTSTTGNLAIALNDGLGNLKLGQTFTFAQTVEGIAAGDLNGDKKLDLVVICYDQNGVNEGSYSVLLGNGDGTFQSPVTYPAFVEASSQVSLGDFNNDGKIDLVFSDAQGDSVALLLGNNDGTFGSPSYWVNGSNGLLALADFNLDGNLDVMSEGTSGISLLLGKGDGTFQAPTFPLPGEFPCCVGDLNRDGRADVVAQNSATNQGFLGNGDGTFYPANGFPLEFEVYPVGLVDVSGDGVPDLFLIKGMSVFSGLTRLGNGDGTFGPSITIPPVNLYGYQPLLWQTADMNADGKQDFILNFNSFQGVNSLIYVVMNTTSEAAIASLSPTALNFGSQTVGAGPLLPLPVTLTNTGAIPLNVASVAISGANASEFILTNNCTKIQPLASCMIDVAFSPTIEGAAAAVVTITDNADTGTQTIPLSGSGVAPFAFALSTASGSPSTQTINAGQSAAFQMEINPTDTFGGSVALACTVTPSVAPSPEPTCSLPASINVTTGVVAPFTVTVSTIGTTTAGSISRSRSLLLLAWFSLPMGLAMLAFGRKKPRRRSLAGCCVSVILLSFFVGCGGGNSGSSPGTSSTPAGTYTVNVTASSQGAMVNLNLTVVVR